MFIYTTAKSFRKLKYLNQISKTTSALYNQHLVFAKFVKKKSIGQTIEAKNWFPSIDRIQNSYVFLRMSVTRNIDKTILILSFTRTFLKNITFQVGNILQLINFTNHLFKLWGSWQSAEFFSSSISKLRNKERSRSF